MVARETMKCGSLSKPRSDSLRHHVAETRQKVTHIALCGDMPEPRLKRYDPLKRNNSCVSCVRAVTQWGATERGIVCNLLTGTRHNWVSGVDIYEVI